MAYAGAVGKTRDEMASVLHFRKTLPLSTRPLLNCETSWNRQRKMSPAIFRVMTKTTTTSRTLRFCSPWQTASSGQTGYAFREPFSSW